VRKTSEFFWTTNPECFRGCSTTELPWRNRRRQRSIAWLTLSTRAQIAPFSFCSFFARALDPLLNDIRARAWAGTGV